MNARVNAAPPAVHADEIDLIELFRSLWQQKVVVVATTLLVGIVAAIYAWGAKPYYQTQSVLKPATIKDLGLLNGTGVYTLDGKTALKRIERALNSYAVRFQFFQENPALFESLALAGMSLEQSFDRFNEEAFSLAYPDIKRDPNAATFVGVNLTYPDGMDGVAVLNGLVQFVIMRERQLLSDDFQALLQNRVTEVQSKIDAARVGHEVSKQSRVANLVEQDVIKRARLQDELSALREQLRVRRQNRIQQLNEAITIARELKIEKPATPASLSESGREGQASLVRTEVTNQQLPLYFMGVEALSAELRALQARKSDDFTEPRIAELKKELRLLDNNREVEVLNRRENEDFFLKNLAKWEEELAYLKGLSLDFSQLNLVTVDRLAVEPLDPVKPKKLLIVLIGLVLGGMLGLFIALIKTVMAARTASGQQGLPGSQSTMA